MGSLLRTCALVGLVCITSCPAFCKTKNPLPCKAQLQAQVSAVFKPIDSKYALFEIDQDYVLQALCTLEGDITTLKIYPKHFFEQLHPEWKPPDDKVSMLHSSFDALLEQIEKIRPLGKFEDQCTGMNVSNGSGTCWERHAGGYVDRLDLSFPHELEGDPVVGFTVYFFRSISGKIQKKWASNGCCLDSPPPLREFQVKLDGKWYWISEKDYGGAYEGKRIKFKGAGPLGD